MSPETGRTGFTDVDVAFEHNIYKRSLIVKMFGGEDEDGDFLSPAGGAKLASLFGLDQDASQSNESFQYTAPKQPRKSSNPMPPIQKVTPSTGTPMVLFATAAQAFRYINGQYVKQGKLGAAILGNHSTNEYKLLLYLSQQKQVTSARVHTGFMFTVQSNNYCTFYDDQRQNWSLMFESEKALSDFCKQVCLAKANSNASLDVAVVQDLSLGEGQAVENGDSLEVAYTGWLLQNHIKGQLFDSNQNKDKLLRLKLGAGQVIKGWEEGMRGMKKAGRRFIVIPPNLAYGSKGVADHIPANSTLIFEAELRRVKFAKDSASDHASASSRVSTDLAQCSSPTNSMENPQTSEPPPIVNSLSSAKQWEPPIRPKSDTISQQLATPDATKAKLISRMAKMGQPMLPFLTGVADQPESSDSEMEESLNGLIKDGPAARSPVHISTTAPGSAHAHPHNAPLSAILPVMSNFVAQPGLQGNVHAFQSYSYAQTSLAPSQLQPVAQVYPAQTVPYIGSSEVTSFLMTEARQQNTEIRLAIGKVTDKMDQLSTKIDDLQRNGNVSIGLSGISMETSMIMHNIQRMIQENENLKREVFEKSSHIEEQHHKISELLSQNQRYMEQSNLLLEQRNESLQSTSAQNQATLLQAEKDKVHLTQELASSTARLSQLQLEASAHQHLAMELQSKLSQALQDNESYSERIVTLETQHEEVKEAAERVQAQYCSERQKREKMELRVINMEEELQDLKTGKERLEQLQMDLKEKWDRKCEEEQEMRAEPAQKEKLVRRVAELEKMAMEKDSSTYSAAEVKNVMNGIFHSLRGEFDLSESYSGKAVLGVIVSTIKNVTLQLLSGTEGCSTKKEALAEKGEEVGNYCQSAFQQNMCVSGRRGEKPPEKEVHQEESIIVSEVYQGVATERGGHTDLMTQKHSNTMVCTEVASSESKPQEARSSGFELDHEQGESGPENSTEKEYSSVALAADSGCQLSYTAKDTVETVIEDHSTANIEEDKENDIAQLVEGSPATQKSFGCPAKPPPPPPCNVVGTSQEEDTNLSGGMTYGEEQFFQNTIPPISSKQDCAEEEEEEEEEDELSLKGHPPPAPLFGEDEDDRDLDWLS